MGLAVDAGEAVDVFDVLAAQDVQQRFGRNDAEQTVVVIHHRDRVEHMVKGQRGDLFLIHIGVHARRIAQHEIGQARFGRRSQQVGDADHAEQAAFGIGDAEQGDAFVVASAQRGDSLRGSIIGLAARHAGSDVMRRSFAVTSGIRM